MTNSPTDKARGVPDAPVTESPSPDDPVSARPGVGAESKLARRRVARGTSEDEAKYPYEELVRATAFGVAPEVVAGALRLAEVGPGQALTWGEVEDAIEHFLSREVTD